LLERARREAMRVWAEQSLFDLRDELKRRGYRWSEGADGRPRSWYTDVDADNQANEIELLRRTIYLRDVSYLAYSRMRTSFADSGANQQPV
jgi:DNA polymerase III subunit epsilon